MKTVALFTVGALCAMSAVATNTWTTGTWSTLPPSYRNVLYGLTPETSSGWETSEPGYTASASALGDRDVASGMQVCGITSGAVLTYTLPAAKDIAAFHFWGKGSTAHNGIAIASIKVTHADDTAETIDAESVSAADGTNPNWYGFLDAVAMASPLAA